MKQKTQWILLAVMMALAGCNLLPSSINTGTDLEFRPDVEVYTYCGSVCLAKGQCGEITRREDGTTVNVVLVNPTGPATEGHGAFIEDNFPVTVREVQRLGVILQQSNTLFENYPFYRVADTTSPTVGWVDGVCLADTQR